MAAKWFTKILLTLLAVGLLSNIGLADMRHGQLEQGDAIAEDGSYYDEYTFSARDGDPINIFLSSDDFDTYLVLITPSGDELNDDDGGEGTNSRLSFDAESGEYSVMANSYDEGETGRYDIEVEGGSDFSEASGGGSSRDDYDDEEDEFDVVGYLEEGDEVAEDGSYYDEYTCSARRGNEIEIMLSSDDFDTYLVVITPSGDELNDDDGGEGTNSSLSFEAEETGEYTVIANSYEAGDAGRYLLEIQGVTDFVEVSGGGSAVRDDDYDDDDDNGDMRLTGYLDEDDAEGDDGSYYDGYTFRARRGERILLT